MKNGALLGALALSVTACAPRVDGPAVDEGADARGGLAAGTAATRGAVAPEDGPINPRLLRRFRAAAPPTAKDAPPDRVALGKQLFHDKRLSKTGEVSCNSCHDLASYGDDGVATSTGVAGRRGTRNAPTVYNASANFTHFWDGRAATLEEQAKGPLQNPLEMDMRPADVVGAVRAVPEYVAAFAAAFPGEPDAITFDNVAIALASFERTLVTTSRWDRFLGGDAAAITREEMKGLKTFVNSGCMVCHTGVNLGGASFERLGAVEPWPASDDLGRMAVTHQAADRMMFKVPTLRNVAQTGPYFHDGSSTTLDEAVQRMGRHQLGLELSPDETTSIVAWLNMLTGEAAGGEVR